VDPEFELRAAARAYRDQVQAWEQEQGQQQGRPQGRQQGQEP
jgi:hypothetical protein